MVDLESTLGEILLREEPEVPLAAATLEALAEAERGGDLSIDELRRYAFADPAVALQLLGAANAAARAPVGSLPAAEALLGEAAFVRLVRGAKGRAASAEGPLAIARRRAWRGCVVSAMLCRELARDRGLDPDEAYACGLLHDAGRLAAFALFERLAAGTRSAAGVALPRWEALADRWHAALGAALAERHLLPRPLLEAIAFHHPEPARGGSPSPLLRVVRSVDALVAVLVEGSDSGDAVDGADLSAEEAARLARAVERMHAHVASLERRAGAGSERAPRQGRGLPQVLSALAELPALRERKGDGVRLRLAGREYAAVGFGRHQLLVAGPAPLGEGALLEVEVLDRRRAPFHARVLTAWPEGGRFGAILLPLGLSGPSLGELGGNLPAGADA